MPNVVGLGEILWDILPGGSRHLGGAPMNVAVHAQALGCQASVVSAVGDDELGREAIELLTRRHRLDASAVQVLADRPTGAVDVQLKDGQPTYVFRPNVAWDFLEATTIAGERLRDADAVVFGTLAQRNMTSRHTIEQVLTITSSDCLRVFDVNLRAPFYSDEVICESISMANVLKLNDAELPVVLAAIDMATDSGGPAHLFSKYPQLNVIAVTRGEHGSMIYTRDRPSGHALPAKSVAVKDTVGAGDAFTAAVTAGLLRGNRIESVHEHAVEIAAYVCSQAGATPRIPTELANL
jgi:fructokinase